MQEKEIKQLKDKIIDHEKRIEKLERLVEKSKSNFLVDTNLSIMCDKYKIDIDQLRDIFHKENEKIILLKYTKTIIDTSKKIQNISLLLLWGYKYLLNQEGVSPTVLKEMIEYHRISTQNFSKYIVEIIPSLIFRKGTSPKNYAYKLTSPGIEEASNIIKEIV